jgi:hypothetical protein
MTEQTYHDLCVEILELLDYYIPEDPTWPTCWDGWRQKAREKLSGEVVEDDIDLYLEQ